MQIIADCADFIAETTGFERDSENEEGVRADTLTEYGNGWFILRMSLHEPLLVLQVENDVAGKNQVVFEKLATFFTRYSALDLTALNQVLAK